MELGQRVVPGQRDGAGEVRLAEKPVEAGPVDDACGGDHAPDLLLVFGREALGEEVLHGFLEAGAVDGLLAGAERSEVGEGVFGRGEVGGDHVDDFVELDGVVVVGRW